MYFIINQYDITYSELEVKGLTYLCDYTHPYVHTSKNNQECPVQPLITSETPRQEAR